MKMLITGAAGFIGSHLAEMCLDEGHEVVGIDCFTPYYAKTAKRENLRALQSRQWQLIEADLLSVDLTKLLKDVDVVFHLAAQPGVRASWGATFSHYVDNNIVAMQRLLEAARQASLRRFVFASSSSVYGDAETLPTVESTPLQPISPYGASKAVGEHLCRVYRHNFALPTVTLRYFTVYGPRQRPDMAFNRLIRAALEHGEIRIFGDGNQTRDFTFVLDAARGTLAAGLQGRPGAVYNLGGGSRTSMNEVLSMLAELTGEPLRVTYRPAQEGDARDTAAETSAAREELGFRPSRTLHEGLAAEVEWLRESMMALPAAAAA